MRCLGRGGVEVLEWIGVWLVRDYEVVELGGIQGGVGGCEEGKECVGRKSKLGCLFCGILAVAS